MGIPKSFTVRDWDMPAFTTEDWFLDEEHSTEHKLVYIGYDANLYPFPVWKKADLTKDWAQFRIKKAQEATKDFKGEVWLDEVRIDNIDLPHDDEAYVIAKESYQSLLVHKNKVYRNKAAAEEQLQRKIYDTQEMGWGLYKITGLERIL